MTRTVQINVPNLPGKAITKQLPFLKNDDGISNFKYFKFQIFQSKQLPFYLWSTIVLISFHETVIEQEYLRRSSLRSAELALRYFFLSWSSADILASKLILNQKEPTSKRVTPIYSEKNSQQKLSKQIFDLILWRI